MLKNLAMTVLLVAAACGGKNKEVEDPGSAGTIDPNATTGDTTDRSGSIVSPEKMDEVQSALLRKNNIVSRCLSQAVEAGTAPKGSRGKITLGIKISPQGQATSVEVLKTSIESNEVQGCVKRKVEEISFPTLPKEYETSYTYAMEAN